MSNRIPPVLEPYIRIPEPESLTLITSVLGATANWLVLRYLHAALSNRQSNPSQEDSDTDSFSVVLVSFLRDFEFWKTEARRSVGLDLAALHAKGRFVFVDGLTHLFTPPSDFSSSEKTQTASTGNTSTPNLRTGPVPARASGTTPSRGPAQNLPICSPVRAQPVASTSSRPLGPSPTPSNPAGRKSPKASHTIYLTSPDLKHVEDIISEAINRVSNGQVSLSKTTRSGLGVEDETSHTPSSSSKTIVIIDTPSILLALQKPPVQQPSSQPATFPTHSLQNTLHNLRLLTHSVILSIPIDPPFLTASSVTKLNFERDDDGAFSQGSFTEFDANQASFVMEMGYEAGCVLSCRMLKTGSARDVSGVLRVCRGGGSWESGGVGDGGPGSGGHGSEKTGEGDRGKDGEGEWLYHVKGDGSVYVWSRGD